MAIADKIAENFISHSVDLQRYSESVRIEVKHFLEELKDELEKLLNDANVDKLSTVKKSRLDALLKEAKTLIASKYLKISKHTDKQMKEVAILESLATAKSINIALGQDLFTSSLTQHFLAALASDSLISGAVSKEWWKRQGEALSQKFSDAVRVGVGLGESTNDIVRRIRGESTGRRTSYRTKSGAVRYRTEFRGGIMTATTNSATTLVLTALQSASSKAREALYQENEEVVKGQQALATLDTKTSVICRARSGKSWTLEGKPLKGTTEPFPGPTPWHWRCRTVLIPILKSWEELGAKLPNKNKIKKSTQASMDGQVSEDLTYQDWLRTKSKKTQQEVLGAGKYKLWNENKLELSDMIDQKGNPLTLQQLKQKYTKEK